MFNKKSTDNQTLKINCKIIKEVNNSKYLGLIVDQIELH